MPIDCLCRRDSQIFAGEAMGQWEPIEIWSKPGHLYCQYAE